MKRHLVLEYRIIKLEKAILEDMDEDQFMTYGSYLDSIGVDPDEYDKSLYLDEIIMVDDNNKLCELKTIGRYSDRF